MVLVGISEEACGAVEACGGNLPKFLWVPPPERGASPPNFTANLGDSSPNFNFTANLEKWWTLNTHVDKEEGNRRPIWEMYTSSSWPLTGTVFVTMNGGLFSSQENVHMPAAGFDFLRPLFIRLFSPSFLK